ncbi:hypothetical protein BG006_005156 [Podila minutissima]|uniref:C2H2-type domain-containing protein n=1 Tax=Podila minutissima TaxID=64525 RepID=A0A9P5SV06_9FUNG|nr:hypothetical protein BG006_005156 [Podila minutissima]
MPHMLQRQLSRTLCDEYTNIFDDSLSQSHVQAPLLVSMSEVSSRSSSQCFPEEASALLLPPSPVSLRAMETTSWSPSSVATPGYSPSSETDDSILLDSLSSPASPLFPVLQTSPFVEMVASVASTTATVAQGSVSCSPEMLFAEDDDFFHNSFYRSLDQGRFQAPQVPICPHSQKQSPSSLDTSCITISDKDQKSALSKRAPSLTTAAPSEIFNITMNELLSVDPLQLSQATTTSACSSSSTSTHDTEMAIFVATLESQIELCQATDLDEFDVDFSETSTLSDVSDDSDGDYVMARSVNNNNNNNNNKRKPSSSSKATKRRPRQESKHKRPRPTVQKTPKVYPPRKPRTKATESGSNTNISDVINTILTSGTSTSGSPSSSSKLPGQKNRTILSHPAGGFMCDQCPGERFGRVHDLKRHQDSKHFVMTWPCDFCHRPFVRRDALLRHYVVKSARHDGIHPTESESHRLYEAKARAKAKC